MVKKADNGHVSFKETNHRYFPVFQCEVTETGQALRGRVVGVL